MLIIPAIHLRHGMSVLPVLGEPGTEAAYPQDPIRVIRMWRGENAKVLHVIDHDAGTAAAVSRDTIKRMIASVDISLQFQPVSFSSNDVMDLCEHCGLYRLALPVRDGKDRNLVIEALGAFGPSRIVAVIEARVGDGAAETERLTVLLRALSNHGLRRWIYAATEECNVLPAALSLLAAVSASINLAMTLHGFVNSFPDLRRVQNGGLRQLDSLLLDAPLSENAFPCQAIWRRAERRLIERGTFP